MRGVVPHGRSMHRRRRGVRMALILQIPHFGGQQSWAAQRNEDALSKKKAVLILVVAWGPTAPVIDTE
jgi:hypothetical protein